LVSWEVPVLDPLHARADVSVVVWAGEDARPGPTLTGLLAALDHAERGHAEEARAAGARHAWLRGERLRGEVVLVADVSEDAATGLLGGCADARVRVVRAPGAGRGRGRNLGVAAATGRYLLFTDADVQVPEHWVWAMVAPLRAGHADLVAGAVRLAPHLERPWTTPEVSAAYLDVVPDPPAVGREFAGTSMGASRAVLESVGFDEALGRGRYPGADDIVFRRDVIAAGYREHAVADAAVERWADPVEVTPRALAARARAHGRCAAYVDRHLRGTRRELLPGLLRLAARTIELALRAAVPGRPRIRVLRTRTAVAYHREMLHLRSEPARVRPRGAARELPTTTAALRAVAPVAPLVSRAEVAPTVLPPLADPEAELAAQAVAAATTGTSRGAVAEFWKRDRLRRVSAFPVEGRSALRRTSGV
jgi:hypothetical protein